MDIRKPNSADKHRDANSKYKDQIIKSVPATASNAPFLILDIRESAEVGMSDFPQQFRVPKVNIPYVN